MAQLASINAAVRLSLTAVFGYALIGFAFFLSVADNALGRQGLMPLPPTIAAVSFLLPLAAAWLIADLLRPPALGRFFYLIRGNAPVLIPFLLLAVCSLLFSLHPSAYWGEGRKWIFLSSYDFLIFFLAMLVGGLELVRGGLRVFTFIGLLILLGSITADIITPGTFSGEPMRAAGFPGNSNWGALSVVMLTAASLHYDPYRHRAFDTTVLILGGFGVFGTLSRSGAANFILLLLFYAGVAIFAQRGDLRRIVSLLGSSLAIGAAFALLLPIVMSSTDYFTKSGSRLFGFFEGRMVDDGSSDERIKTAQHCVELIEESPLAGYGTGYARTLPMTPHNLYLQQWVNNGLPGVLLYVLLLLSGFVMFLQRRAWNGAGLMGAVMLGSFFSHNVLDQRCFLLLFGCLSTISLLAERKAPVLAPRSSYSEFSPRRTAPIPGSAAACPP